MNVITLYNGEIIETTGESITAQSANRREIKRFKIIGTGPHRYRPGDRVTVKTETTRAGHVVKFEFHGYKGTYIYTIDPGHPEQGSVSIHIPPQKAN